MKLSIILFDGFTTLDAIGGYEVLSRVPGMEVEFVAETRGTVAADTRQLGLIAFRDFKETTQTDILYVPGGPGVQKLEGDEAFLAKLQALDATSKWTIGICNGVGLLAAAGLLEGHSATTNFLYRERLAARGVQVVNERYIQSGKYVTGAGVSASIDAGLFLTQLIAGEMLAKVIGFGIEYFPAPPYAEKDPSEVDSAIVDVVRAYQESESPKTLQRKPPFSTAAGGALK